MATDTLTAAPLARRLDPLRSRLDTVRRRRLLARQLTAWSAVLVGLLAALLGALALDRIFALSGAGRLWLWAGIAATGVWVVRRYALPLVRVRETDLDVALSMEKAHGIDSDFVAALQFERPDAAAWGSSTLRSAVVDYVSEFGQQWTSTASLWSRLLAGRVAWAAALAAVITAIGIASPKTLPAFVNRMLLGSAHYPTWTHIERLVVNGCEIDPLRATAIKAPAGRPLAIDVTCSGRPVATGRAVFTPAAGGGGATVPLEPPAGESTQRPTLAGTLDNLFESVAVVVYAGDARSEPVEITAVPAPVVEASVSVEPPAYARSTTTMVSGGRQAAVLEGSRVVLTVTCLNKSLDRVVVEIDGVAHPLTRQPPGEGGHDRFVLSGSGSPLAAIAAPVQYEVHAVDVDGLSPDRPTAGTIRIRPDMPPQVTAEAVTRTVLPGARPTISYTVRDDHGVAALRARLETVRVADADLEPATDAASARTIDILPAAAPPLVGEALPATGSFFVPLADLGLRKGDFVRVFVEAVDYRGTTPGQPASSPPIELTVTDENGVLEALQASESQAAQELQSIIEEQLRVGGKP